MPKYIDFWVKYDPDKETPQQLTEKIFYAWLVRRLKKKKPAIMFIGGDSGEGKTHTATHFMQVFLAAQGIDIKDHLEAVNVFSPGQYSPKLQALLYEKELKKVNCICIHEARDLIRAKLWHTFVNMAISDVNAQVRAIKRLFVVILSQFIRDISVDIRYTINYYVKVERPMHENKCRARIYCMWKDDSNLEKPVLKTRRFNGFLMLPNGKYKHWSPKYIEVPPLDKDIAKTIDRLDYEAKNEVLKRKLDKLMKVISIELGEDGKVVENLVQFFTEDVEALRLIGKRVGTKWKVNPAFKESHGLTTAEFKDFGKKLNEKLKTMKFFAEDDEEDLPRGDD